MNYPNPFNPSTIITFQIPEAGLVSLKVYDLLGREVATLVDEHKTAGSYDVEFNASELSSGVYFYKINYWKFRTSKKDDLSKVVFTYSTFSEHILFCILIFNSFLHMLLLKIRGV